MILDSTNKRLYDLNVRTSYPSRPAPRSPRAGLQGWQFAVPKETAANDIKKRNYAAHHGIIRTGRTETFFQ